MDPWITVSFYLIEIKIQCNPRITNFKKGIELNTIELLM